jgi:TolA-binding protein
MGCSDTKKLWRQSEIEAIAADAAGDAASDVAGDYGVEDFEQRITALEQENRQLKVEVVSLQSQIDQMRSDVRSLEAQF